MKKTATQCQTGSQIYDTWILQTTVCGVLLGEPWNGGAKEQRNVCQSSVPQLAGVRLTCAPPRPAVRGVLRALFSAMGPGRAGGDDATFRWKAGGCAAFKKKHGGVS